MLTRSSFKKPVYERKRTVHQPIPESMRRPVSFARADEAAEPVEKGNPIQHAGYMNVVRSLPCARCGHPPRSQFCHSDEGKGTGIKSDCRLGWPGCAQCHHDIGTARIYPKEQRRALEAEMARRTRDQIESMGLWPKNLPRWPE
jgi:hypothetical protein